MHDSAESNFDPASFAGQVRLFPLPNLVMFPHVLQPLHVFEPRYRELVTDALASDRLIAMALLAPGWQADYHGRPPLVPIGCLGRIATCHRLPDGRYNLLLQGLRRVALGHEFEPPRAYRQSIARLLDDEYNPATAAQRPVLQRRLHDAFKQLVAQLPTASETLDELLATDIPLGTLTDIVAYTLQLDVSFKARLLGETNVDRRAEWLLEHFVANPASTEEKNFPPDFSLN